MAKIWVVSPTSQLWLVGTAQAANVLNISRQYVEEAAEVVAAVRSELVIFVEGEPYSAETVFRMICVQAFRFAADFAGSAADAGVVETNLATWLVKQNGIEIGTVVFDGGATFTTDGGEVVDFAIDDIFSLHAPTVLDPTMADATFTFVRTLIP